jgi:hypothetical protein
VRDIFVSRPRCKRLTGKKTLSAKVGNVFKFFYKKEITKITDFAAQKYNRAGCVSQITIVNIFYYTHLSVRYMKGDEAGSFSKFPQKFEAAQCS